MSDAPPISLWDITADESDVDSPMEGDVETGVAIVGGGFTGLSTALHAAERGLDCHVLEARRIGHGGSGRNVGLLNPGVWLPPWDVRARLGEEKGAVLTEALGNGPAYVMSLIERHQIRCELTRSGTIHAAHSERGFRDLERRAGEWRRLGAPVELLSRAEASEKIGSDAYCGGLLDRRAGTINPMGYVRGLARAALSAGGRISTGVTARALRRDGDRWIVDTDRGRVSARAVVLGTNAYTDDLWPGLNRTFTIIHYFQVATAAAWATARMPCCRNGRACGIPLRSCSGRAAGRLRPADRGVHGPRVRRRERVCRGAGRRTQSATGLSLRWERSEFEKAWFGQIAMTLRPSAPDSPPGGGALHTHRL